MKQYYFMKEKMTCNSCGWFVEETEIIGDWRHSEAVKKQKGFCLIQDLFTVVRPTDRACSEYTNENDVKGEN